MMDIKIINLSAPYNGHKITVGCRFTTAPGHFQVFKKVVVSVVFITKDIIHAFKKVHQEAKESSHNN
jgi:hypothetical protein